MRSRRRPRSEPGLAIAGHETSRGPADCKSNSGADDSGPTGLIEYARNPTASDSSVADAISAQQRAGNPRRRALPVDAVPDGSRIVASDHRTKRAARADRSTCDVTGEAGGRERLRIQGLDEVQERLRAHPGYVEHMRIEAFSLTLNAVFRTNLLMLLGLLRRAATDYGLQIQIVQNVARPDIRNSFNAAVVHSLHNYVASTMTLVDHSRRMTRGRTDEPLRELSARRGELLRNLEVPFTQDLRNFMLHRSIPFLGHTMTMSGLNTESPRVDMQIELSIHELLQWDGWMAASREFLAAHEGKIALLPIIEKHGDLVFRFNAWIINALSEANREALKQANELVVERNAVLGGMDMAAARRLTDEVTQQREQPGSPPSDQDGPFGSKLADPPVDADAQPAPPAEPSTPE